MSDETTSTTESTQEHTKDEIHELEAQRRANRDAVADLGLDPYGGIAGELHTLAAAAAAYDQAADLANQESDAARRVFKKDHPDAPESDYPALVDDRPRVRIAGRVVLHRDNGKLVWMNLRDDTRETFQIAVSKRDCDELGFGVAKKTDLGDLVVAEGPLMRTKAGEVTVWASSLRPAGKCLVPPPEKRAGLTNVETRYRQRYLDLWATPETLRTFQLRCRIVSEMRRMLESWEYVEVETPMLQAQAGGAAARPFVTHMNALDIELFLRIAPELYLKRLLVGGMPRVFEINRNFRNEGLDKQHNPEFTMLELYHAHGDWTTVMDMTERLTRGLARFTAELRAGEEGVDPNGPVLPWGDLRIDFGPPFRRVRYADLFEQTLGFPMSDTARARDEAAKRGIKTTNDKGVEIDDVFVINELFEEVAESTLDPAQPTFITHYPAAISPLTKASKAEPEFAERADLFLAGMELAPHYTELNDPDVQAARFREQLAGIDDEESTFRNFDEDFIRALKVGMPPAGGMGLGIDRLAMILTGEKTIRDVVLFPLMRPEG
ncbi:MAG: lysine--tRNA ligase [Planctomycetota bacterium]